MTHQPPVTVEAIFDRFPASVRGAIVVRGADREPHQVRMERVDVAVAHEPTRAVREVSAERATVDIAPHGEVFVPFELPLSQLDPGWYCITAQVRVDGTVRVRGPEGGGKRFVVPWPSGGVRRGELHPNLAVGEGMIERIECRPDRAVVRWRAPSENAELRVSADSRRLPTVEDSFDPGSGTRATVIHPVPTQASRLLFEVAVRSPRRARATATLALA